MSPFIISVRFWHHHALRAVRMGSVADVILMVLVRAGTLLGLLLFSSVLLLLPHDVVAGLQLDDRLVAAGSRYFVPTAGALFMVYLHLSNGSAAIMNAYSFLPLSTSAITVNVQVARCLNPRYATLLFLICLVMYAVSIRHVPTLAVMAFSTVLLLDSVAIASEVASVRLRGVLPSIVVGVTGLSLLDVFMGGPLSASIFRVVTRPTVSFAPFMLGGAVMAATVAHYLLRRQLRYPYETD